VNSGYFRRLMKRAKHWHLLDGDSTRYLYAIRWGLPSPIPRRLGCKEWRRRIHVGKMLVTR
jgi:hypothetical protein